MADIRRLVTFSAGGRPQTLLDFEAADTYYAERDSFTYEPGDANVQSSREPGRYGGGRAVDETQANGTVRWRAQIKGVTGDQVAQRAEALIAAVNSAAGDRLLQWRPDGASYNNFFRVAGPARWTPTYRWAEFKGGPAMVVELTLPVRPLVLWDPMRIGDDYNADSLADYTLDTGAGTLTVTGGQLVPSSTAVKRLHHTARGYLYEDVQVTLELFPGTSGAVNDAVVLKRLGASSSLYVQVTQAALGAGVATINIGKYTGAMTTIDGAATAVTLAASTSYWLRGRIEDNQVTVELWTSEPTPLGTPAASRAFTLTAGDATTYGQGVTGAAGMILTPGATSWRYGSFTAEPYVYRNQTLPQKLTLPAIPGTAPALADVTVTPSGGSAVPVFALIGWTPAIGGIGSGETVGVNDSDTAVNLTGWATSAQAGARGGNDIRATTAGAGTYSASWLSVLPFFLGADDFSDTTIELEIWARALISSTLVNPRLTASIGPSGTSSGRRYTHEFGTGGRLLGKPSSGTVYRFTRLGVLTADATFPDFAPAIYLDGSVEAGSTGAFGFDYLISVPARRRALGPTGVPNDAGYPKFVGATTERSKKIRSDLSATLKPAGSATYRDHGLGGNLIQPGPIPAGYPSLELLVKLSSLVPDDPTVDTTSEQLAHSATVQLDVTPRSYLLRGA